MRELSVSQAQSQFTKLLDKEIVIVDKKAHQKRAVILPYERYKRLISKRDIDNKENRDDFSKFVGILDNSFKSDDIRYNEIISNKN